MKSIAFGSLRFGRHSIPAELRHIDGWPRVGDSALSESGRDIFNRRIRAMPLFLEEIALARSHPRNRRGL